MKYKNDYETDNLKEMPVVLDDRSGMPKFTSQGLRARQCIKCSKYLFANYEFFDYECMICRSKSL